MSQIRIAGFRSIRDESVIAVPRNAPLVLIGENNAGKSNVVKAIDIVLGELWPSNRDALDHEFWGRDPNGSPIEIEIFFDDLVCERQGDVESIFWAHSPAATPPTSFGSFLLGRERGYVTKPMRQKCQAMIVGADRRLAYQLSYTSKWTLLSKLMRRFHDRLVADPDRVTRLQQEFQAIVAVFGEVEEFKSFQEGLTEQLGTILKGMNYGLSVDFSAYDPSNYFHSLRVLPNEDGAARTFDELGTGQEQVLALVFAHAYARAFLGGIVLIIEEPEAHLHPLAQDWLARTIRTMSNDGLQIILTTHSPAFVDLLCLEGIALVRKPEGHTQALQIQAADLAAFCLAHGADPDRTDEHTILAFYANSATPQIVAGLFARKIVLVEGQTETMSLPILLGKVGFDVLEHGVAVIPVMGKGNLAKWWRFFNAFQIPVYVVFDNDSGNDDDGRKRSDLLRTIGFPEENIEAFLAVDEWLIDSTYAIFGSDYEHSLRSLLPGYEQLEGEGRAELGGDSKPLIAKYVADQLAVDPNSDGGQYLQELATQIRQLGS